MSELHLVTFDLLTRREYMQLKHPCEPYFYYEKPKVIEKFAVFLKFFKELGYELEIGSNGSHHLRKRIQNSNPNFISFQDALSFFNYPLVIQLDKSLTKERNLLFRPHRYWSRIGSFWECTFTKQQLLAAGSKKTSDFGIIEHQRTKQGITDFPEYKI